MKPRGKPPVMEKLTKTGPAISLLLKISILIQHMIVHGILMHLTVLCST